jgi:hypothetical protein
MGIETPALGIPALKENPFHGRPLETGDSDLLVGRAEFAGRWSRFLHQETPRLILLIGERGSGRTSLLRCLGEESSMTVHLDMFPFSNHSRSILDEIHGSFLGFDMPASAPELATKLAHHTKSMDGPLPLIALDYSNADGRQLSEVTSGIFSAIERLRALVVISLTTDQRAQWPESLVSRFDHVEVLKPLQEEEVRELCQKRVASVSRAGWKMSDEALGFIVNECAGHPTRIIRKMRDMVDEERERPREARYDSELEIVENITEDPLEEEQFVEEEEVIDESDYSGFDLDLDQLAEENNPVAPPTPEPVPFPVHASGPFGGLRHRNRDYKAVKHETKEAPSVPEPTIQADEEEANALWMAEGSEPVLIQEPIPELPIIIEDQVLTPDSDDTESKPQSDILKQIVDLLKPLQSLGIADALSSLRLPIIGQRHSFALDVHTLRNLARSEAILVEVASERSFSPSDARLQDQLRIKRPRMSQICNHLYRAGILSVQPKGRSRMYSLTNDAKAQLVAWGMMEGSI